MSVHSAAPRPQRSGAPQTMESSIARLGGLLGFGVSGAYVEYCPPYSNSLF